jgi:hypothetical protein
MSRQQPISDAVVSMRKRVYQAVCALGPADVKALKPTTGLHGRSLAAVLRTLAGAGFVQRAGRGNYGVLWACTDRTPREDDFRCMRYDNGLTGKSFRKAPRNAPRDALAPTRAGPRYTVEVVSESHRIIRFTD